MSWKAQEAEQRFSELVRKAQEEGPQLITRQGAEVAVLLSAEAYRRLTGELDFKAFLRAAPEFADSDSDRSSAPARIVDP